MSFPSLNEGSDAILPINYEDNAPDSYMEEHKKDIQALFTEFEGDQMRTRLKERKDKLEKLLIHFEQRRDMIKERLGRVAFQLEEKKQVYMSQRRETGVKEVILAIRIIEEEIGKFGKDFSMLASLFQFIQSEALEMNEAAVLQVQLCSDPFREWHQ